MSAPLSNDLRMRIVRAHLAGEGTYLELAARFGVGAATISRILARHRRTGDVEPEPHVGGNPARISNDELSALHALVEANPDVTQQELVELGSARQVFVSAARASHVRWSGLASPEKKSASGRGSSSGTTSRRRGRGSQN